MSIYFYCDDVDGGNNVEHFYLLQANFIWMSFLLVYASLYIRYIYFSGYELVRFIIGKLSFLNTENVLMHRDAAQMTALEAMQEDSAAETFHKCLRYYLQSEILKSC